MGGWTNTASALRQIATPERGSFSARNADQLFIFLALGALIEADRHAEAMESRPASDKHKIGNLKCDTLRWTGRNGRNAAACQIAHNPAHQSTSPTAIVNAFRNPPIAASAAVEAFRF